MENSKPSKINSLLKVNYRIENSIWLTSSYTLRMMIGILGMALPLLLYLFLYIDNGYYYPLESISHYYYTRVGGIFVIIVSQLAIFLIVYKGRNHIDFYISLAAGIFALFVLLFPTSNITNICFDISKSYSVTILKNSNFRESFHYVSAGIFLLCLSFMSLFLFTKSDKSPNKMGSKKKIRNRIFRTCGIIMIVSILIILAGYFEIIDQKFYSENKITFWMETLAIESFGFAWLIKGKTFFKDNLESEK